MTSAAPPPISAPPMTHDIRLKRLAYRAHHRGFKEADLLVGQFADAHLATMSESELDEFERVLELIDQDIYDWYLGRAPVPADAQSGVLTRLMAFRFTPPERWT